MGDPAFDAAVERIFKDEFGRVVASLARRFGDLDVAEDAAGEALVVALEKWRADGIPPNPGGWLTTTAGNRAIDRIRRESRRMTDPHPHQPTGPVPLRDQDRAGWDRSLVAEGHHLVRECLARAATTGVGPGRYQLLAAVTRRPHRRARRPGHRLGPDRRALRPAGSDRPVPDPAPQPRRRGRELDGPTVALSQVDRLDLAGNHAWHATRADLLRRLGRTTEARAAYDAAIEQAGNAAEQAGLTRRRDSLVALDTP